MNMDQLSSYYEALHIKGIRKKLQRREKDGSLTYQAFLERLDKKKAEPPPVSIVGEQKRSELRNVLASLLNYKCRK